LGGLPFAIFWGCAALLVLWEWTALVSGEDRRAVLIAGAASVLLAVVLAASAGYAQDGMRETRVLGALTVLAMGMLGTAALAPRERRLWIAGGIPYAGLLAIAPVVLRADPSLRVPGDRLPVRDRVGRPTSPPISPARAFGGPKLAPRISPKKTWSGAVGGTTAAVVAALAIAWLAGLGGLVAIALVAIVLSAVAQAGDLFESALEAAVRRQGFEPLDSRPRRADGSAGRVPGGRRGGGAHRRRPRRSGSAGTRLAGMVIA